MKKGRSVIIANNNDPERSDYAGKIKELDHIKPVYGILRPAKTWNPILINFKHLWQLIQDAYVHSTFRTQLQAICMEMF